MLIQNEMNFEASHIPFGSNRVFRAVRKTFNLLLLTHAKIKFISGYYLWLHVH